VQAKDEASWDKGVNNYTYANDAIQTAQFYGRKVPHGFLSDKVYRMLNSEYLKSWKDFATTKYSSEAKKDWEGYLSLEFVHNNMHVSSTSTKHSGKYFSVNSMLTMLELDGWQRYKPVRGWAWGWTYV
jgi:hypothetical protein